MNRSVGLVHCDDLDRWYCTIYTYCMYKSSDLYWNSLAIPIERCIVWKHSFHYDSINILYQSSSAL